MFAKSGLLLAVLLSFLPALAAQEVRESDLSLNVTGLFGVQTQNNGVTQRVTDAGGGLATFRHHFGHRLGIDLNYGFARDTYYYLVIAAGSSPTSYYIQTNVHEATGDVLFSAFHHGRFSPYILGGGGELIFAPTGFSGGTSAQVRQLQPAILYGAGTDVDVTQRFALRLQYRGFFYRTPDFGVSTLSTGLYTHTAEPSLGIVYRFSLRHF